MLSKKGFSGLVAGFLLFNFACANPEVDATSKVIIEQAETPAVSIAETQPVADCTNRTGKIRIRKANNGTVSTSINHEYTEFSLTKIKKRYKLFVRGTDKANLKDDKDVVLMLGNGTTLPYKNVKIEPSSDGNETGLYHYAVIVLREPNFIKVKDQGIVSYTIGTEKVDVKEKMSEYKKAFAAVFDCK